MAENSKIEWCHHTANLWWGCTKVHAGCDHCYAETLSHRWGFEVWGNGERRRPISGVWKGLNRFQKIAKEKNEMHRVFVGSMMDIFEKPMKLIGGEASMISDGEGWYEQTTEDIREVLFDEISQNKYPNLMFLFLTKRPSNINKYIPEAWKANPPSNVMYGTSPCDQETFDTLVPQLMKVSGKHFLSIEPLLGPIDIRNSYPTGKGEVQYGLLADWIIVGGESGPGKRPMEITWAEDIMAQSIYHEIPFFMKQIDKVIPVPEHLMVRQYPRA